MGILKPQGWGLNCSKIIIQILFLTFLTFAPDLISIFNEYFASCHASSNSSFEYQQGVVLLIILQNVCKMAKKSFPLYLRASSPRQIKKVLHNGKSLISRPYSFPSRQTMEQYFIGVSNLTAIPPRDYISY